jgi:hypothetical protein
MMAAKKLKQQAAQAHAWLHMPVYHAPARSHPNCWKQAG